jgi:outer membrane protein TolC
MEHHAMNAPAHKPTTPRSTVGLVAWLVLIALASPSAAQAQAQATPHAELDLVRAYLSGAPQHQRDAAARGQRRAAAVTAPYLAHPELGLRREQSFGDTAASTTVAGLSLSLALDGRHGLNQQAASLDAQAVAHRHEAWRRATVCQLRRLVGKALARQEAVGLLAREQKLLLALGRDLEKLVKAGERAPYDLNRLRLHQETKQLRLAAGRARLRAEMAQLSALTGLSVERLKPPTGAAPAEVPPPPTATVRALKIEARAQTLRKDAADRRWIPSLGLYGAYRLDQAPGLDAGHGYEAGLNVSLPFTDAGRVERARAEARRGQALAEAASHQSRRGARLRALRTRSAGLRQALKGWHLDLSQMAQSSTRQYLSGEGSMAALIDTQGALWRAELQRAALRGELRATELETACVRGTFDDPAMEKMVLEVTP